MAYKHARPYVHQSKPDRLQTGKWRDVNQSVLQRETYVRALSCYAPSRGPCFLRSLRPRAVTYAEFSPVSLLIVTWIWGLGWLA